MRRMTLAGALAALTLLFLLAGSSPAHAAPTFTMTIDDDDVPASTTNPPCDSVQPCPAGSAGIGDDDCVIGVPCEMYQTTEIPAGEPFSLADTSIPKPKFTISNGFYGVGDPDNVPNGTPVGAMGFKTGVDISPCLQGFHSIPYPASVLVDAALPDYTIGPWAGNSNGMAPEGPETASLAGLFTVLMWPIELESDAHATALWAAGYPLIARYHGNLPTGGSGTPVNMLVFETPTSYVTTTILGAPSLPPSSPFCTETTTATDFLGSTNLGAPLRQCNVPGTALITATFLASATAVDDAVSCSGVLPGIEQSSGDFCITGTSTGAGWEWRLFFTTGPTASSSSSIEGTVAVGPTSGSAENVLATAWVNSMHDPPAVVATASGNCFRVVLGPPTNATASSSYFLFVAPIGGLECQITPPPGCSFNPIVYYVAPAGGAVALAVSDAGSPLPVVPLAASVTALAAALSVAGLYARRRWLR